MLNKRQELAIIKSPMPRSERIILIAILSFIAVLVSGFVASAGIDIGGAICFQEVSPGQHVTHKMTVLTDKDSLPVDIEAKVMGWTQGLKDELVTIDPSDDQSSFTAASFLKVTPERLHVGPGVLQEILLEGDVPDDAGPGALLAVVQIKTLPVDNKSSMAVVSAVNVPVKLVVNKGNITRTGEFTVFNITPGSRGDNNITVSLMLKNTGNTNYYPVVKASLRNESGNILETKSIESSNTLLPTHARQFNLTLRSDGALKLGTCYVNATACTDDGMVLASKETSFKV
jgi:hypothetical protein